MMSAPIWCWIAIDTSGVNLWVEPSRCDVKVTPSSSTRASRSLPSAMMSSARTRSVSIASTLRKPAPSDRTWNPPLSVKVGPGPVHERAQSACLVDDVGAGLQVEVVGVRQNSLCAKLFHRFGQDGFDGGLGADGDEGRSVDVAVRCSDHTGAPQPSRKLRFDAERRLRHVVYSISRQVHRQISRNLQDRGWAALHTLLDGPPILTVRDNKRRTVVKRGFVVAVGGAAIVIAGLSGCSSDKKSETSGDTSSAASAEGKSTVTIDGKDQAVQGTVVCSTMGEQRQHRDRRRHDGHRRGRQLRRQPDGSLGRPRQRQRRHAGIPGERRPG